MSTRTLGLDLGPNSIGWALIEEDEDHPENSRIVDMGVRIFPEGVDNFDTAKEFSRNEQRRIARGMRRQTKRRARRMRYLKDALIESGLFSADAAEQTKLYACDPYELRSRALSEKLAPHEIGRLLLHLSHRRGFLSNRKKDRGDKEVQGMLAEINELGKEMEQAGASTLGDLLHKKASALKHKSRSENDHVRNRHTERAMYETEFDAIWTAQQPHHPKLLTEQLKYGSCGKQNYPCKPRTLPAGQSLREAFGLHGLIFFQRKMYWPKSAIGLCEYESRQLRCPRADRRAQRFRLLQEVNNLRFLDLAASRYDREEIPLSDEQRTLLVAKLSERESMTFDQIRKALGFLESIRFNLERGKRSKLQGHLVDYRIAKEVGKTWHERSDEQKDEIVRALIDNERDDDAIVRRAVNQWSMTAEEADDLLGVDLPSGYLHVSLKAINKLLPFLDQGMILQGDSDPEASALHAADYLRRDELRRRIFDRLPDPKLAKDCPIGDLPNPVVRRTLVEVRKVINAILGKYDKPDHIHVEMGRDVKTRPKKGTEAYWKYKEHIDDMRRREADRDDAAKKLRENNVPVNRDTILRYLLWQQQRLECIYTGEPISFTQLFSSSGGIDVDHILPYSRCLDDSQMNKVVCYRHANADKANHTPYEWLGELDDPTRFERMCQQASALMKAGLMPYGKYRRFSQRELKLDDFIERQLNDMRYISKATAEYLRCLMEKDHHVLGLKGQLTAELRHQWGLDTLLEELPDSPAWREKAKLRPGQKNRADHRHHAVDALVIALTNRKRLQELSRIRQAGGTDMTGEILPDPWDNFRDEAIERVKQINVSHRAERKVGGALHEETLYRPARKAGEWVVRKAVETLSPSEIGRIRDGRIRQIVTQRLKERGIEFGRGKKVDAKLWKQALTGLSMPSGVPIKKVRITKPDKTVEEIRHDSDNPAFVKPGSTHHLCIFEWEENGDIKREPVFVTMLKATNRLKDQRKELAKERERLSKEGLSQREQKEELKLIQADIANRLPVIERIHPDHPDAKFVMSLSRGELVQTDLDDGERLLVFRTAASTSGQMWFTEHTDARRSTDAKKHSASASTLKARKVTIDPLGRVRWAND